MQHQVSANGRSVINSGITEDYKQAFVEYIWNGFDAGATEINISYVQANELGALESVCVSDNGKGINKNLLEFTFGAFLDSQKRSTFQRTSEVRGKKGKGRFSFKAFATEAEWVTRYLNEDRKLMQYSIKIDIRDLSKYEVSEDIELDQTLYSTGTDVKFSNINKLSVYSFTDASFTEYIAQQYAWFLCLNKSLCYLVKLNGVELAYDHLIACEEEKPFDISDTHFDVTYIRWNKNIGDKFYFYMMNSNLHENFKELTSFNNNTINFYHSVYVTSSYFNDFIFEQDPSPRLDNKTNQSDRVYKVLKKELKVYLEKKQKEFVSEIAAVDLINKYESLGVLPRIKANKYEEARRLDLIETIKQIYIVQPKIFKGLKLEQEKVLIGFLNLLLDTDERDRILEIIDGIVSLTEEERVQFAKTLRSTSMSNINRVVNMMRNRLEVIECLKTLVYDLEKFTNERDHIQKIIEQNYWIFGESYHLASADVTFERALSNYLYLLDGQSQPDKTQIENQEANRRPDIFMCRSHKVNDAKSSSMLEENIIVELKRPSVNIGITQYRQIEDYLRLIKNEPKFNSQSRLWKFYVISAVIDDDIKSKYESFKSQNKRYLVYFEGNYEIYALSWDDVFQEFYYKHDYMLSKFNFSKESIKVEIENVRKDAEGSNTLTQRILSLETQ